MNAAAPARSWLLGLAVAAAVPAAMAASADRPAAIEIGGRDDPALELPRPPGARRLLSYAAAGQPYALTVFQDGHAPEQSRRLHRLVLARAGYDVRESQRRPAAPATPPTALIRRGQVWGFVVSAPARAAGGTVTTMAIVRGAP